jgi:hypothetical protein
MQSLRVWVQTVSYSDQKALYCRSITLFRIMSERGPGPRVEQAKPTEKRERRHSPIARKLALVGTLLAGFGAMYEHHSSIDADQSDSTDLVDRQGLEALGNKLNLAARIVTELKRSNDNLTTSPELDADAQAIQTEHWFELKTALQNAQIDLEAMRTFRSRDPEDYANLGNRITQHPEAVATFEENLKKLVVEQTDDGIYAHLDGELGFDLVISVDSNPKTHEPIMRVSYDNTDHTYDIGYDSLIIEGGDPNVDPAVQLIISDVLRDNVEIATRNQIKTKFPDFKPPTESEPALSNAQSQQDNFDDTK